MRTTSLAVAAVLLCLNGCLPAPLDNAAIDDKIATAERNGYCLATALCVDICDGNLACRAACLDGTETKVRIDYDALTDCTLACAVDLAQTGQCADATNESCKLRCRTGRCRSALITCAARPHGGTSGCMDGSDCLDTCGGASSGDGLNCGDTCVRNMVKADADALVSLTDCYASLKLAGLNKTAATAKLLSQCGAKLTACYARGTSGALSCLEGMTCVDDCVSIGDTHSCQTTCAPQLTSSAQGQFVKLFVCFAAHGSGDWTMLTDCAAALSDCAKSQAGGRNCTLMQAAFYGCLGQNDRGLIGCLGETLASGRFVSAAPFLAAVACLATECSAPCSGGAKGACAVCSKTKCNAALKSCSGG